MKIVDLTQPLVCGRDIQCRVPAQLPVYLGHECEEYQYSFHSHLGCYYETSAHLYRGGKTTSEARIEDLIMPALIPRLDKRRDGAIEPEELAAALKTRVRPGDALVVDAQGQNQRYFSRGCGAWMAARKISLLGATMPRFDTGFVDPTGIFVELFDAEIPIIANLQNVDKLAHERVFLIVMPLAIQSVCTAPCRVVALDGDADDIEWLTSHLRADME